MNEKIDDRFVEATERCHIYAIEYSNGNTEYRTEYQSFSGKVCKYYDSSLVDARATAFEMDQAYREQKAGRA